MSATDTATAPAAAPLVRRVLAQAGFEIRALARNGEQLLISLLLPALVLFGLSRLELGDLPEPRIDTVAPGVLAMTLMSLAFTSQAIATGFDRRNGVLRLLATTPLGRGGLLAGKMLAVLVLGAVQAGALGGLALALGWRPVVAGFGPATVVFVLGAAAFVALGLLTAGTLRAEAVIAVANLVWVLLLAGGAVLVPATNLPGPLAALAPLLPSGALGEGLRAALMEGRWDLGAVAVLVAWTVVLGLAVRRAFRWE